MLNTNQILKISDAASLGMHTMLALGSEAMNRNARQLTTAEIANHLGASEAHLSKVLQRLVHAGLVHSTRGPKGGFALARAPQEISLLAVYEAIDGTIGAPACLLGKPACDGHCVLGDLVHKIHAEVRDYLSKAVLSDLSGRITCEARHA